MAPAEVRTRRFVCTREAPPLSLGPDREHEGACRGRWGGGVVRPEVAQDATYCGENLESTYFTGQSIYCILILCQGTKVSKHMAASALKVLNQDASHLVYRGSSGCLGQIGKLHHEGVMSFITVMELKQGKGC